MTCESTNYPALGQDPSVASLHQALAESEDAAADAGLVLRPKPVHICRPGDPFTSDEIDLRERLQAQPSSPCPARRRGGALTAQVISRHITCMTRDDIDGEAPTLDQARRQVEHYGLEVDPQAVLVAVRLISAGARVGRAAEAHFARFGLSTGRYRLLADLEDHGGEKSPSHLAADLNVSRATVTGLLDGLEREGLIARRPSTEDGRGTVAILTARGARRLRDMASEHFGRLEAMVGGLSVEERAVFLDLLARVVRGSAALAAD